jgi:hypothetical protein
MIVSDLAKDPYSGRVVLLLYGEEKVGKTTTVLNMIPQGNLVYMMSFDQGTMKLRLDPSLYQNRILLSYPDGLREIRDDLEVFRERVKKAVANVGAGKVWVVLDTVTHMQDQLLSEARKMDVKQTSLKAAEKKAASADDEYMRDMTTQLDYGINLAHMNETINRVLSLQCNIVLVALERTDKEFKNRPRIGPRLSGQAYGLIVGAADAIIRLTKNDSEERVLHCAATSDYKAGDRSGQLGAVEPPDLPALRKKMLKITDEKTDQKGKEGDAPAATGQTATN